MADTTQTNTETNQNAAADKPSFDEDLIKKYPRSNRKIAVEVHQFGLQPSEEDQIKGNTSFISPYGLQFQGVTDFEEGTLLKIQVAIPDYWTRKQKFADYSRIDTPDKFRVLAKVVRTEDVGKRGKKKMVTVQTLIMDEVDEKVLKTYLQEG